MLKKSASGSSARRAGLPRQARHASSDSECLAFLANLASCCPRPAGHRSLLCWNGFSAAC